MRKISPYLFTVLIALGSVITSCEKQDSFIPVANQDQEQELSGVLYTSNANASFEIYKLEGETATQLTQESSVDAWWARYCPSNKRVLYYTSADGRDINDYEAASLRTMDLDGGNDRLLIESGAHGWDQHGLANWSHNGTQIVMAAVDTEIGKWQIYITDAEGQNPERVSSRKEVDYLDPIFDHDDASIICVTIPEGEETDESNYEVIRINLNDSTEERLTNNNHRDHHPDISSNGEFVVFESLVDPDYLSIGKWGIKEVRLSNGNEREVLVDHDINLFPRYTPDGESIIFTRLKVETFNMTVGQLNRANDHIEIILPDDGHHMNGDPY